MRRVFCGSICLDVYKRQAQAGLNQAQTALAEMDERRRRLAQVQVDLAGLKAELTALTKEGQEHNERIAQLETETGGECPVCGQPLTEEHRATTLQLSLIHI